MMTIRRAAVLLAAAAAMSGCAAHPAQHPAAPGAGAQRTAELALTQNAESMRESWYLSRAEHALEQQCLQRMGFRYLLADPGPVPGANTVTGDALGTGRQASYAVAPTLGTGTAASPEDLYVASLSGPARDSYLAALDGPTAEAASLRLPSGTVIGYQTGGCVGQARRRLYGSVAAMAESQLLPQDVTNLLSSGLGSDPAYRSASDTWQRCMRAAGLDFVSPQAAIDSVQQLAGQGVGGAELNQRQTTVAVADTACDLRSGLRRSLDQARAAFLRRQPATVLAELDDCYTIRQRAYRVALTIPWP